MAVMFKKVVMAGVGLICGSLALDMRRSKLAKEIIGYGRGEANLRLAQRKGIVDGYFLSPQEFPEGVDLLMMGTPVEAIAPLTEAFLPRIQPGCIVSDVGSV
jgi:prephenate dehydrogenase